MSIPNHVFAQAGQGANEASLESDKATLFYLCGRYNYAARGDVKESLSLYTLGHIFEQSITELVPPSGSCDSALREGTEVVLTTLLFGNKTGVESVTLWHDESEAETGGCDAPIGRRSGDC